MVALVLSLGITSAFAAGEGSLTVENSETGTSYKFYKIFDLTGKDGSDSDTQYDAIAYTIDPEWTAFFNGAGSEYIVATNNTSANNGNGLNPINVDGTTKYINITESNKVAFTNAAMKYAIDSNLAADATATGNDDADVSVDNLNLGYYLMVPVNATDEKPNDVSSGSIASLTSTIPDGTIVVKATKPGVEKTDNVVSADLGKEVTYTVNGKVPNTSGTTDFKYVLYDKMSSGLTFQKNVAVTIGGTAVAPATVAGWINYEAEGYENGFVIDIPVTTLQAQKGQPIVLTYTAIVNENAIETSNEKNEIQLKYGRGPGETTEWIREEVYSAKIDIYKYTGTLNNDGKTGGTPLADATFVLMNSEGKYYKYTAATATTPATVSWVDVEDAVTVPVTENTKVTDAQIAKLVAAGETITTKTTNAQGAASFDGLADGTYYLIEIVAPSGYNRLDAPKTVTVQGTDVDTATHLENHAYADTNLDTANNGFAAVQNNSGTVLPSTGGIGTTIFYVVGGVLVLAAIILLVTKKRMSD